MFVVISPPNPCLLPVKVTQIHLVDGNSFYFRGICFRVVRHKIVESNLCHCLRP